MDLMTTIEVWFTAGASWSKLTWSWKTSRKYCEGSGRHQNSMRLALHCIYFSILLRCFWMSWCGCFSIETFLPATRLLHVCKYGAAFDQGLLKSRLLLYVARCHWILQEWFQQFRVRNPFSSVYLHRHKLRRTIANIPWHMQTLV